MVEEHGYRDIKICLRIPNRSMTFHVWRTSSACLHHSYDLRTGPANLFPRLRGGSSAYSAFHMLHISIQQRFAVVQSQLFLDSPPLSPFLSAPTDSSKSHQLCAHHYDCVAPAKTFRAVQVEMRMTGRGTEVGKGRRLRGGRDDYRRQYSRQDGVEAVEK